MVLVFTTHPTWLVASVPAVPVLAWDTAAPTKKQRAMPSSAWSGHNRAMSRLEERSDLEQCCKEQIPGKSPGNLTEH